jgi:hypothetical protein
VNEISGQPEETMKSMIEAWRLSLKCMADAYSVRESTLDVGSNFTFPVNRL